MNATSTMIKRPRRVLISVTDKKSLDTIARFLVDNGVEIISSGGTEAYLKSHGIKSTHVSHYSGNPEAFNGRMKTLSFPIFSGILYDRSKEDDVNELNKLGIAGIDGVICNFYPFEEVAKKLKGANKADHESELVENIDIGGPAMVRAAAKNYHNIFILTSSSQYNEFMAEFEQTNGEISVNKTFEWATSAFKKTLDYDLQIFKSLSSLRSDLGQEYFDCNFNVGLEYSKKKELRYGENSHQKAQFIPFSDSGNLNFIDGKIHGKELSYNNLLDLNAAVYALKNIYEMTEKTTADLNTISIIKHQNPCALTAAPSVADNSPGELLESAWECDPVSSFGGIVAFSFPPTLKDATFLSEKFVEVVCAPSFSKDVLDVLSKKKNIRLIEFDLSLYHKSFQTNHPYDMKLISGGMVMQEMDTGRDQELNLVTDGVWDIEEHSERFMIDFGIACAKSLKSNAIAIVRKKSSCFQMIGAGMGNPNRLVSFQQAIDKVRDNGVSDLSNLLMVSDAFFPFPDIVEMANEIKLSKIVQPGGSINDNDIIKVCNGHKINMIFTNRRHFAH